MSISIAREGTRMPRYPDFMCIGAQKAATSWLTVQLRRHPDIWIPPVKEIHYFDPIYVPQHMNPNLKTAPMERKRQEDAVRGIRGFLDKEKKLPASPMAKLQRIYCLSLIGMRTLTDEWYGRIFEMAEAKAICGELTPEYALLPDSGVEHIMKLNPDIKIIFIMRDPIDRAWSALRMLQRSGGFKGMERAIRRPGFLAFSDYMTTIERYRRFVAPGNLLLLYFDDVAARPRQLLEQVCKLLGIPFTQGNFANMNDAFHKGQKADLDADTYGQLKKVLAPAYERLLALENPIVDEWYRKHFGAPSARPRHSAD